MFWFCWWIEVLAFGPVSFNLLNPTAIAFPCVKRWVNAGASTARCGRFRNPPAILLPAICVGFVSGMRTDLTIVCFRILCRIGVVIAGPGNFFAVLHKHVLWYSLTQMLRGAGAQAQELHHNAESHFLYDNQYITAFFNLMKKASAGC